MMETIHHRLNGVNNPASEIKMSRSGNPGTDNVSSHQLASKLRKIKENLDNCYLTSSGTITPPTNSNTNYNNNTSVWPIHSTMAQSNHMSSSNSDLIAFIKKNNLLENTTVPANNKNSSNTNSSKASINNTPSSTSSISKMLFLNNENNFDFELNNDTNSLDFILAQYIDPDNNNNFNNFDHFSNNIQKKKTATNSGDANPTNLISLTQTVFTDNLSRQSSIRSLLSNHCDNTSNNTAYMNTKASSAPLTVLTKTTNVNLINSASSGVLASVGVCTIPPNGLITQPTTQYQHKKFKQIKAKSQAAAAAAAAGHISPVYMKHEIELLNDWDRYRPNVNNTQDSAYMEGINSDLSNGGYNRIKVNNGALVEDSSSNTSSPIRVLNKGRPETRLGFQLGDSPDSLVTDIQNGAHVNDRNLTDCYEYSDNVTIMSSPTLSYKYYMTEEGGMEQEEEYEDDDEPCQNDQLTPTNEKMLLRNNFNLNSETEATLSQNGVPGGRLSVQSVLSNFASNLKFEEYTKASNPSSSKKSLDEFNHDFDVVTVSEAFTDDAVASTTATNRLNTHNQNYNQASLIIREKKSPAITHLVNKMSNDYENTNDDLDDDLNDEEDEDDDEAKSSSSLSHQRVKNYQRLSHSINDLFSNLLTQLEKQKNKDYIDRNSIAKNITPSNLHNMINSNSSHNDYANFNQVSPHELERLAVSSLFANNNNPINAVRTNPTKIKSQNLSKDSNKDSGFNQEFNCGSESFIAKQQLNYKHSSCWQNDNNSLLAYSTANEDQPLNNPDHFNTNKSNGSAADKDSNYLKPEQKILCDDLSELSLLDRFLNNEQLVAFKQSKLERLLAKKYNINDYSIIEYLLNQESISVNTFKTLIREKFKGLKWSDEILNELHKIINQPIESQEPVYTSPLTDIDPNRSYQQNHENVYSFYDDTIGVPDDHQKLINNDEDKKSQTSSLKSFKKIKLIKNTINQKRKMQNELQQQLQIRDDISNNTNNSSNQELLKNSLSSSFAKRRERKGSLPEINTSHIVDFDNTVVTIVENHEHQHDISATSNQTLVDQQQADEPTLRMSRKNAFVLECLRTSMFRSKSLSDLNTSLVKIESNTTHHQLVQQQQQHLNAQHGATNMSSERYLNNKFDDTNINGSNEAIFDSIMNESYSITNFQVENYTGLIWQCADMIHEEYRNKYEELRWLMNGDNLSVVSKLKEVEQRLLIEIKIREKNSHLLNKFNKENLSIKNKYVHQRLDSQLKIINEKIKELEMMRLFLKMCEINNRGCDNHELSLFFNLPIEKKNTNNKKHKDNRQNLLEGKSYDEILKSLFNCNHRKDLILDRTIDLIGMWIDGFYIVDFQQNQELVEQLELFIENLIKTYDDSKYLMLYNLLIHPKIEFNLFNTIKQKYEHKSKTLKKVENETKKVNRILNGALKTKKLGKCKSTENLLESEETFTNLSNSLYKRANFFIDDYPCELIASQLTLIEWDNFLDIHVCHCLNSRAQGVNCDSRQPIDPNIINTKQCLFVDNYLSKSLYKMIQFNYLLTHWVSAEILMMDNLKSQATLITKFLKIAKKCYDWSNFSSAFSIYDGLQEVTVRNLRAWQQVPNKTFQILEKIATVKLLFQNEPFLLNHLTKTTNTPVIPSMHLFLLIVQKSEHGSFQLANGEWKWSKLSYIANLVDQIRIVQQHFKCSFMPCEEFVDDLLQRIYYFKEFDLNHLAENNSQDYFHNQRINTSSSSSIKNLIPLKKR